MNRLMWICMAAVVVACGPTPEGICEKINDECDDIESLDCEDFAEFYDDQYDDGSEGEREDLDDMLACADEKDSCRDLTECVLPFAALQACEKLVDECEDDATYGAAISSIDCGDTADDAADDADNLSDDEQEAVFESMTCMIDGSQCSEVVACLAVGE